MKATVSSAEMLKALKFLRRIAPVYSPKPVLQCCVAEARKKSMSLSATDLEVYGNVSLSASVIIEGGTCCFDIRRAISALGVAGGTAELLSDQKHNVSLAGVDCQGEDPANMPAFPRPGGGNAVAVPDLPGMLRDVAFAAAKMSSRYLLNYVLLESAGGRLVAAATDGCCLSVAETAWPGPTFTLHLSAKLCNLVISRGGEPALRTWKDEAIDWLRLDWGSVGLSARSGEGRFPTWREIIPVKFDVTVVADAAALRRAATAAAGLNLYELGVRLRIEKDKITVWPIAKDENGTGIAVVAEADGEAEICFNAQYLADGLATCGGMSKIALSCKPHHPTLITRAKGRGFDLGGGIDWQFVLMPITIRE